MNKVRDKVVLIGNANVGKSVIFGLLTGKYVVVSNYPGTTVEIARSDIRLAGREYTLIDTPGVANLLPMSSDEVVTRDILLEEGVSFGVQVADSKNLARTLAISLQLTEMGIPFVLDLNMADEARQRQIEIDTEELSRILGVSVVSTVAVSRKGIEGLKKAMESPTKPQYSFKYSEYIENAVAKITPLMPDASISRRSLALMVLAEDSSIMPFLRDGISKEKFDDIYKVIRQVRGHFDEPVSFIINKERMSRAREIADKVSRSKNLPRTGTANKIGKMCMDPVWGVPILIGVLGIMYYFVGVLAAGVVVDFIQEVLFEQYYAPWISGIINRIIPWAPVADALTGEYGLLTTAMSYALAIVLPIVTAFFLFFSILEDSGYLPRLAIVANRTCKVMGLNGKAVLPMILGLGCGTMAALSARILDSKKEQLMVILLISLGIPCSAQLGVIMGMLAGMESWAFLIWLVIITGSMVAVGWAANKILPGETSDFILEIPPLRIPDLRNIFIKTLARVEWYLKEALPIFMLATFFLFLLDRLGFMVFVENISRPLIVNLLGLPVETTSTFIVGFLRRDYAAAGLLDMARSGLLSNNQLLVAMVTITLFLPCVAQFIVIIKEKGIKNALGVSAFILAYSFGIGSLLNLILGLLGVNL